MQILDFDLCYPLIWKLHRYKPYNLHNDFFLSQNDGCEAADPRLCWNHITCTMIFFWSSRSQAVFFFSIPGCVESNCAADEFASKGKRGAGKLWQSLLPSSPTRVMHQNQFCISSPAAKTSLAFNPSSVSPSSRDANTQMIFSAMQCTTEWDRNDMRERSGLVSCTYYYSTQIEILVGTAQQKCKSLSIYFTL